MIEKKGNARVSGRMTRALQLQLFFHLQIAQTTDDAPLGFGIILNATN